MAFLDVSKAFDSVSHNAIFDTLHTGPGGMQKRPNFKKLTWNLRKTWYLEIVGIADYESEVKLLKLKMADLI